MAAVDPDYRDEEEKGRHTQADDESENAASQPEISAVKFKLLHNSNAPDRTQGNPVENQEGPGTRVAENS